MNEPMNYLTFLFLLVTLFFKMKPYFQQDTSQLDIFQFLRLDVLDAFFILAFNASTSRLLD